jgi:outer membrane receptor protein involved in Fe transport
VSLELRDGKTELALWARNLLDRRHISHAESFDDGFGVTLRYPGPPRMYGIEVRRTFSGG